MPNRSFFASSTLVFAVSLAASNAVTAAHAQTTPATTPTTAPTTTAPKSWSPYDGVINSDDTLVRCAPSIDGGYAFGRLAKGATVRVVEEQSGWVRVAMTGPSFEGWCGYVQATPTVALSADGKTLKASGRAQVNAPNAEALFAIERSWKPIAFLTAGDELPVVSVEDSHGTTWYRIALNEKASGWINSGAVSNPTISTGTTGTPNTNEPKPAPQPTGATGTTATDAATETTEPQVDPDTGEVLTVTPKVTDPAEAAKADEAARTKAVEQVKRIRFSDIDAAWTRVAKEPVE
ncbi:MAG: GW dipeptide domain-containing protein, partial [Planctomycetota bacterium]